MSDESIFLQEQWLNEQMMTFTRYFMAGMSKSGCHGYTNSH